MKFTQILRMAFSAMKSHKMRSFLTMLGIIIGVMAVSMLVSLGQGVSSEITGQIEGLGSNLITVSFTGSKAPRVSLDEIRDLEGSGGIAWVSPSISGSVTLKVTGEDMVSSLEGVMPVYLNIRGYSLLSGRYFNETDMDFRSAVAVIGTEVADKLFGSRDVIGETLKINGRNYKIIGILEEQGSTMMGSQDNVVQVPFTNAQRLLRNTAIRLIYVTATSADENDTAVATLSGFAMKTTGNSEDYSVFNQASLMKIMGDVTATLTGMLAGIAAISLLVGGIGIMNIMLVSVTERTKEIGIRKAVGAKEWHILAQFLVESVLLSFTGGIIGLFIGALLLWILSGLIGVSMQITVSTALFSIVFSTAVGIIFGIGPAKKASSLHPIEALRYD
ncbi:MAG: ABC transporter permease [Christensenellales bacterium]|jgi:putative ABC transport system permease protein